MNVSKICLEYELEQSSLMSCIFHNVDVNLSSAKFIITPLQIHSTLTLYRVFSEVDQSLQVGTLYKLD